MKFFLQILAIIGFIIVLFFLLGYSVSQQTNISTIEVKAPIKYCWDMFHNEEKMVQWNDGVEGVEFISGSKFQVGAQQKITLASDDANQLSSLSEIVRTIKKIDAPTFYQYDYSNDILDGSTTVRFERRGDSATLITNEDKFKAKKLWMRSILFLMKPSIGKKSQAQFDRLSGMIENEHSYGTSIDTLVNPEVIKNVETEN